MRYARIAALILASVAIPAVGSRDAAIRGKDLIEQASSKTNIFELPSFRMKANVRINNDGKMLEGTYLLLWNGPDHWREEIVFPGYSEIQMGRNGKVYLKRSASVMPYRVFQLHSLLGFGSASIRDGSFFNLKAHGSEKIDKIRESKLHGSKLDCVEISDERNYLLRKVCIDQVTGRLNRENLGFVDAEWTSLGSKIFPRSMKLLDNGRPVVTVDITDMQATDQSPSAVSEPPSGWDARPGCMNPIPEQPVKDVVPRYPEEDKRALRQGVVAVYAVIDQNGNPQELQITLSSSSSMNESSVDAIRQRRYTAATCNGNPVPTETVIVTRFTMR